MLVPQRVELGDQFLAAEVNGGAYQTASSATGYFWNLFAFPFSLGSRKYAFLTDHKTVLGLDESTFRDLIATRGGPVSAEVTDEQLANWTELGLVSTKSAGQQFTKVFASKSAAPRENELLHIITSYTCNLTCSYCFMLADLGAGKKKILTFADARKGMDLYFSRPHKKDSVVHFYGGEPLLHPQFIDDCLGYINSRYSTTVLPKIITNGTLYGQRVVELLRKYHFDLSVSMDGDRKAHDVFRVDHSGRSTFDKTVRGIRQFQEIGYDPKMLITVGEHNIRRLPEVVEAVLDLGPHAIALNFPRELPKANNNLGDDAGESRFWVDQYELCLHLCYERNIPELYFADMLFAYFSGQPVLSPCAACGKQVSIGPGAEVGPCQAFVAADLFTQSIELFGTPAGNDPFVPWQSVSKASSRKCSRCPISAICGGDCSFDRYNRTGSLHEPLPFHCDLRLRMAELLGTRLVSGKALGFAAGAKR
ncbi:MAG: radical SAM protein [Pseudonocardiaceae bacterium]